MTLALHLLLPPQKPFTLFLIHRLSSFLQSFSLLILTYSNPKFEVSFFYSTFFALPFLSSRKLSKIFSFKNPSKSLSSFIFLQLLIYFLFFLMGDHFALFVDQLLTESTLEATIKNHKNVPNIPVSSTSVVPPANFKKVKDWKIFECRICHEEDEASNMENPCSCSGSMKYAHRKCVQKWCNEKGDTTCEICLQKFVPGYTAPQELFHHGGVPMNFRGSWEISSRDLHDSQLITMVPSDRFTDTSNFDYYPASNARSTFCCRSVAAVFTTLVLLRHSLPLMINQSEYSMTLFALLVLRTMGILIPVAVMLKILSIFYKRRHRQIQEARSIPISGSDEESLISSSVYQPQPHLIRSR